MLSIKAEGLTKRFRTLTAVDRLSFEVEKGEIFGLLGPNGAGKTTTLRMLASLILPSDGSAKVQGYDVAIEPMKVREMVGILTENQSLYERLSAYENMDFFAEAYGAPDSLEKKNRIRELLEFFGLWERREDKVSILSRGMKQKLAIARALVHNPPILLLDEPTGGLDPESSKMIRDMIERLSRQQQCTVLLCTHRLEDAEKMCDRVMIINKGKGVIAGTPEELEKKIPGRKVIEIRLKKLDQQIIEAVRTIKQVREINVDGSTARLKIIVDDFESATPEVIRSIVYAGGLISSVNVVRPSLEEAYLSFVKEG